MTTPHAPPAIALLQPPLVHLSSLEVDIDQSVRSVSKLKFIQSGGQSGQGGHLSSF